MPRCVYLQNQYSCNVTDKILYLQNPEHKEINFYTFSLTYVAELFPEIQKLVEVIFL